MHRSEPIEREKAPTMMKRINFYVSFCALLLGLNPAAAQAPSPSDAELRAAFLYAYPYYEFMWLRDQALQHADSLTYTSLNKFRHQRHLATPADRWANGPINDTFYSTAWLDVGKAPVVLTLPDTADRYYVLVLIGADTNSFAYFGRRSSGTKARKVAIIGPAWQGAIPPADEVVRASSRDLYVNLRVLVRDPADLTNAHRVQDGFGLVPVAIDAPDAPDTPDGPRQPPLKGDVGRMFDVINEALIRNPPPPGEAAMLQAFKAVGICGAGCSFGALEPALQQRWRELVPPLLSRLKTALDGARRDVIRINGWIPFRLPRNFAANFPMRAGSAANSGGIFGLEAAEAVYFMGVADGNDELLGQGRSYRLHLPAGGLPADAFWSLSLYEFLPDGQYMVANKIDRYSIGDRTPGLVRNGDGSLDLWIQPSPPSDPGQLANWLPSPLSNKFYINARIYQPRAEALKPEWAMPKLERQLP
jgi:hypothetical protein